MKIRDAMSWTIQSTPPAKPPPVKALHAHIRQCRLAQNLSSSSSSRICSAESAPSMSCLLANTRSEAPARRCASKGTQGPAWWTRWAVSRGTCGPWAGVAVGRRAAGAARAAHLLLQQRLQLCLAVPQPHAVGRVHHPDQAVRLLKVVAPVGAQRGLPAHIPDVELEAAVLEGLDVEAQRRRDQVNVLAVELLDHRRLARVVQPKHEDAHLPLFLLDLLEDGEQAHGPEQPRPLSQRVGPRWGWLVRIFV